MEPTENFVRAKLEEWGLAVLCKTFEENCIDDKESFELLNDDVLKELIPKVGLRLKFTARLNSLRKVGTNLPAYLDDRHDGVRAIQPSVLVLGTRKEPSQSFVIVDGLAIEANSLLKAVDICFKAFYVLDVCYPKQCHTTWEFIQKFFYKMGEGKGKSVTSAGVRSLRTFIEQK